jgi:hypothetical protein
MTMVDVPLLTLGSGCFGRGRMSQRYGTDWSEGNACEPGLSCVA